MEKFVSILFVTLIFVTTVFSQKSLPKASPESVGMLSERLARQDEQMHNFIDKGELSSVQTAIIRKGKLVHWNTYGHEDIGTKEKLKDNSIWRIYSMTKPIVSVGIMMLYVKGMFQTSCIRHRVWSWICGNNRFGGYRNYRVQRNIRLGRSCRYIL